MTSVIASMIEALFPKAEFRVLMVGLDASGKTTILYKMKLGEVVTTIPTIGFNVETIQVKKTQLTMWDVGGCDKIRPLWRHYYQNTQALVFVVDSTDTSRMATMNPDYYGESSYDMLRVTLQEEELREAVVLVFLNKQDLPNARSPAEIEAIFNFDQYRQAGRIIHAQPCCGTTGDGLYEGFYWLENALNRRDHTNSNSGDQPPSLPPTPPAEKVVLTPEEESKQRIEQLLVEWLERVDDSDEDFLAHLRSYTLDNWDHRTHLRIAWLVLTNHGRKEGLPMIFDLIRNFIANSPRTQRARGTTFHETMTYFWVHMVHYAMVATRLPKNDFKTFLLMNPQLANGGLFLHYYSKQRMLHDADARTMVLLPDKLPLPSVISSTEQKFAELNNNMSGEAERSSYGVSKLKPSAPLTDSEFLSLLEKDALPGWGHDTKLRIIYLLLCRYGRSSASVDHVLAQLARIEKDNAHLTLNYFWIQMVTYHIASEIKMPSTPSSAPVFSAFNDSTYVVPNVPSTTTTTDTEVAGDDTSTTIGTVEAKNRTEVAEVAEKVAKLAVSSGSEDRNMPFGTFIQLPHCQALRNQLLYEKYYSRSVVDDPSSATSFAMPNMKQLPKFV